MYLAMLAMAPLLADVSSTEILRTAPMPPAVEAPAPAAAEISVLTYNIKGLPWPVATGRARALREIGEELGQMRREGRQPDVVLLQEGFRGEVRALVAASGYRYWAHGPARGARAEAGGLGGLARVTSGEGWGKLTGGGLHVLSDLPITDVRSAPYGACAGFDCLANKGVMMVRLSLGDPPFEIDVVNTHMNSRRAARVPAQRALAAHNRQTEELLGFLAANATPERPLLIGGDFNVRNAPERYYYRAEARPYTVVSEFCRRPDAGCDHPDADAPEPWLTSQDLQAFVSPASVRVRPVSAGTVFDGATGGRLSDHDGYLVRYRLTRTPGEAAAAQRGVQVRPQFPKLGAKVSWTY
ncbi:endonuclease/exonuclease/phosphatase family protein [Phenylobacterium sp.]|uniref:endonuclease/exonuclease/phosphatase family protein n=1 Tax=Phenylobacterium sp. TaxID=1871053 RepID=UPI002FE0B005